MHINKERESWKSDPETQGEKESWAILPMLVNCGVVTCIWEKAVLEKKCLVQVQERTTPAKWLGSIDPDSNTQQLWPFHH